MGNPKRTGVFDHSYRVVLWHPKTDDYERDVGQLESFTLALPVYEMGLDLFSPDYRITLQHGARVIRDSFTDRPEVV